MAVNAYGLDAVTPVYCDCSANEDKDNIRFRADVEQWTGKQITVIRNEKFRTVEEVNEARQYMLGFKNNNCKACNKATSLAYWVLTRRIDPEEFRVRAEQSRRFGARMTRWNGKRIFLDEIPPDDQIPKRFLKQTENVSCGPECGLTDAAIRKDERGYE
jgi:nitrogen fixation protein